MEGGFHLTLTTEDFEVQRQLEDSFQPTYRSLTKTDLDVDFDAEVSREKERHEKTVASTKRVVKAWIFVALLEALIVGSEAYVWVLYGRRLGASNTSIALSVYCWFFVAGCASVVTCSLADRFGYDWIALICSTLLVAATLCQALASTYPQLCVGMGLLALAASLQPLTIAYIAKMLAHESAVQFTGIFWALFSGAYLMGPLCGGLIEYALSYRAVFDFGALLAICIFCVIVSRVSGSERKLFAQQKSASRLYNLTYVAPDSQFPSALKSQPPISKVRRDSVVKRQSAAHCRDPTDGVDFAMFNSAGVCDHFGQSSASETDTGDDKQCAEEYDTVEMTAANNNVNGEGDTEQIIEVHETNSDVEADECTLFLPNSSSNLSSATAAGNVVSVGGEESLVTLTGADAVSHEIERSNGSSETLSWNVWVYFGAILLQNALVVGTESVIIAFYTVYCHDKFGTHLIVSTAQVAEFMLFFAIATVVCTSFLQHLHRSQWWLTLAMVACGSALWALLALFVYPSASSAALFWLLNPAVGGAYGVVFLAQEAEILRIQPRGHCGTVSAVKNVLRTVARAGEALAVGLLWHSDVNWIWYAMAAVALLNIASTALLAAWAFGWAHVIHKVAKDKHQLLFKN